MPETKDKTTWLSRLLSLFADVRDKEAVSTLLLFLNIFLLLTAYYVLKTVREGLMLGGGGLFGFSAAEIKSYSIPFMALLLAGVIPLYGVLADRVSRIRLLNLSIGFVVFSLMLFFALGQLGLPLGVPFFLWLGIVNVFLVSQFWSFANDIYDEAQGKRLFALVATGQSLGAICGPSIARAGRQHTYALMLCVAAVLVVCAFVYNWVDRRESSIGKAERTPRANEPSALPKSGGGFRLILQNRYLLLIALLLLAANLVNTTGEFILGDAAETLAKTTHPDSNFLHIVDEGARKQAIRDARVPVVSGFYGSFFFWVNLLGFLIQAFLVSRIFRFAGVRAALFVLPVIALGGYAFIGVIGGMMVLRVAKTLENSTDYSLQNTVRQTLFLPTTREEKYKAKAAIDTFFVRIGDAISAGVVFVGIQMLGWSARGFAYLNVGIVLVWLFLAAGIARRHKQISNE